MNLVDDVYAFLQHGWGIDNLVPQVADVIYAVVAGSVDFQYVRGIAAVDGFARKATVAGIPVDRLLAIHCFCENFRRRGFACSAGSAEKISMGDSVFLALHLQKLGNMLLPGNFFKRPGSPFSIKCLIQEKPPPYETE